MNIKPMLVRLEGAMDRNDLIEQMVLLPEPASAASKWASSTQSISLVVGYNASPNSQTALDLTMWIAHQTRLATQKQVMVQVVYVVEVGSQVSNVDNGTTRGGLSLEERSSSSRNTAMACISASSVLTRFEPEALTLTPARTLVKPRHFKKLGVRQSHAFEQADQILWQARCLAQEWRGSFNAHLRFGDVATELRKVVESEAATLLFLGCKSVRHPIVQNLGANFPCSVLGIPHH